MQVGTLIKLPENEESNVFFSGHLKTLKITLDFELIRNPYKSPEKEKHPDYHIYTTNHDGKPIPIGVAWHYRYVKNGKAGETISLTFDEPSFNSTLKVTAFKSENDDEWPIIWQRERLKHNA